MTGAVLVSGGTGTVGRFVVERFLAGGREVVVMGRRSPPEGFFSAPIKFVEGALDPERDQSAAFEGVSDFVHAAFDHLPGKYRGGEGDDPQAFVRRNLDGTAALFEQARAAGVARVAFLSSRAVYGDQPPGTALTETTEPRPDTLYGEVKLAVEQALSALWRPGFAGTTLRVTGVYGPAAPGRDTKWSGLFADYLAGRPVSPRIGTEVHGDDVAAAVEIALGADPVIDLLNVSDLIVDRHDLLAIVKDVTGATYQLPERADASALNVMDCSRLASLGWRPGGRRLLRETVARICAGLGGVRT